MSRLYGLYVILAVLLVALLILGLIAVEALT